MYILEEFDKTLVLETCLDNHLKKFVRQEEIYKLVSSNIQEDTQNKEEEEEESKEENEVVDRDLARPKTSQLQLDLQAQDFEIVLLQRTLEQRKEYIQYKEDDEGNIL